MNGPVHCWENHTSSPCGLTKPLQQTTLNAKSTQGIEYLTIPWYPWCGRVVICHFSSSGKTAVIELGDLSTQPWACAVIGTGFKCSVVVIYRASKDNLCVLSAALSMSVHLCSGACSSREKDCRGFLIWMMEQIRCASYSPYLILHYSKWRVWRARGLTTLPEPIKELPPLHLRHWIKYFSFGGVMSYAYISPSLQRQLDNKKPHAALHEKASAIILGVTQLALCFFLLFMPHTPWIRYDNQVNGGSTKRAKWKRKEDMWRARKRTRERSGRPDGFSLAPILNRHGSNVGAVHACTQSCRFRRIPWEL